MNGVLVVDKPQGMTSAAVVSKVKRSLGVKKVGHTGTLDPMATGVLPLCIGEGTKIAGYLLAESKTYLATIKLGVCTDTLDADGEVTEENPAALLGVTEEKVQKVVEGFLGESMQIPPMFSALKHKGQRLHKLARAGKTIDVPPREICVHAIEIKSLDLPSFSIEVSSSKGTYIRAIARDIGSRLGCGAHLASLRRIQSGEFGLESAVTLEQILDDPKAVKCVALPKALTHMEKVVVKEPILEAIINGKPLNWLDLSTKECSNQNVALLTPKGDLAALVSCKKSGDIRYLRVFTYGLTGSV